MSTRQTEDTMYAIHAELTESKLWSKFNKQIKKWKLNLNINGKLFVKRGNMP
jgi:hypothetical protein